MRKVLPAIISIVLLVSLVILSGCQKAIDYIVTHPTMEDKACRITKFTSYNAPLPNSTATIEYNSYNNPIRVTKDVTYTGYFNYEFNYDSENRLSQIIYGGEFLKTNYFYNNKGLIDRDSVFFYEFIGDTLGWKFINTDLYTYDAYNRIIKEETPEIPYVEEYQYGTNGNLMGSGYTYDDRININRTNKIWMFLNRDYSINNVMKAESYSNGLPLMFRQPTGPHFLDMNLYHSDITYSCK